MLCTILPVLSIYHFGADYGNVTCLLFHPDQWKNMSKALASAGHSLVAVQDNLIDAIWMDRPTRPSTKLLTLGLGFTGR